MGIPVTGHVVAAGYPLLFAEIDARLSAAGIPEVDGDATSTATTVLSVPSDWVFSTETCWYADSLIDGLPSDGPLPGKERHHWLLKQNVRLACAHRLGCITEDDREQAQKLLDERFTWLVRNTAPRREPKRYECGGAKEFGVKKAATKTDEEARAEVGGHEHNDWMMTMANNAAAATGTQATGTQAAGAQAAATGTPTAGPPAPPTWPHTGQLGMAHYLAQMYGGQLLYVYGLGWHYWDGTRYALDNIGEAKRCVYTVFDALWPYARGKGKKAARLRAEIIRCESSAGVEGILKLAQAIPEFAVNVDDLDIDPYLFNLANGTLDLRTLDLRKHDPADRITKVARAAYDPNATGAEWTAFLEKVLPNKEIREYLQRLVGVALLGKVVEHNLSILTGTGGNGKGTLYLALCFAFGDYAGMANSELFMEHKSAGPGAATPGDIALRGQRLVIVSESGKGRSFDEARLKRLTGGDIITARELFQKQISFYPSHLPLFITNHLPKVSPDDKAVWRRLRVVPFDVVIPEKEEDGHLDEKLEAEADAVLTWAVEGWKDYVARGEKLDEPPEVLAATKSYRTDSDDVGRFLNDQDWIEKSPAWQTTTAVLHEGYLLWAKQEGGEELSLKAFGKALDDAGYPVVARTMKGRLRSGLTPNPHMYNTFDGWPKTMTHKSPLPAMTHNDAFSGKSLARAHVEKGLETASYASCVMASPPTGFRRVAATPVARCLPPVGRA